MAQLVTGTVGAGHWRTSEKDRLPRFNQGRRRENVGGVTAGWVDQGTIPATNAKGRAVKVKPMGKKARKAHRKNVRRGGLGL